MLGYLLGLMTVTRIKVDAPFVFDEFPCFIVIVRYEVEKEA